MTVARREAAATAKRRSTALQLETLIAAAREDHLVLRRVAMVEEDFVFLKCCLEAYCGLGIVVAHRGAGRELTVIGAKGRDAEIDALLGELGVERQEGDA